MSQGRRPVRRILTIDGGGVRGLDAVDRIGELRASGERLASVIDWPAVLEARDERFRVTAATTLPREYCRLGPG